MSNILGKKKLRVKSGKKQTDSLMSRKIKQNPIFLCDSILLFLRPLGESITIYPNYTTY